MPAKAGIQPADVSLTALGLGPSLRWGDGGVRCFFVAELTQAE